MPNAKAGTVTFDVARAVKELKAGKIDFRAERAGIVHAPMGKVSFGVDRLMENLTSFFDTIVRLKPASSKGTYMKSIAISTTMGARIRIDPVHVKAILK
jgi:large subunit ribosomal protein L1